MQAPSFVSKVMPTMKSLKYSDISLTPRYSECRSRDDCDTAVTINDHVFKLPVLPANMKAVIDMNLARWLSENDYFYIMHRFDSLICDNIGLANSQNWKTISFSVGVKEEDRKIIEDIKRRDLRVDFLTIDIAHGHSSLMRDMLLHCRKCLGKDVCIIAGNVCTPAAVVALNKWGADYVKVGIGQGSPCTTKDKTGFTMPMFSCVMACSDVYSSHKSFTEGSRIPIIADGGIKSHGDIAKALVAGADLVMAGSLFASCVDSPAATIAVDGAFHKVYFGSASYENKQNPRHIEGVLKNIPSSGLTLEEKLFEIREDLQSSISYAGGSNLKALGRRAVDYCIL